MATLTRPRSKKATSSSPEHAVPLRRGPVSRFPGKERLPFALCLTKDLHETLRRTAERLAIKRGDVICELLTQYADGLELGDRAAAGGSEDRLVPGKKPPAANRTIPIKNQHKLGVSEWEAAWLVVREILRVPSGVDLPQQEMRDADAIIAALQAGRPVVLTAKLPSETAVTGYLMMNGHSCLQTVTLVSYNPIREAVRLTPSRGAAWGQGGRAWLSVADLKAAFEDGAVAVAPGPQT